ncbi:MAG: lipocalin family protein [Prevotella sp.]|nr:lipocalin family protein [Prevotella sp.]
MRRMKHLPIIILLAAWLATGCGKQQKDFSLPISTVATDDSTIYGMTCDGSNDTILIFLKDPYDGTDPDTLNILEASKNHHVFGSLRIGDKLAISLDSADKKKARQVIVTQDLLGDWCYKVKPTLKRTARMNDSISIMGDSLQKLLDIERELGFTLKADSSAMPIGSRRQNDEESPVEYPRAKRYHQWYIHDGQLLLIETRIDTLGNMTPIATDTTELVMLTSDSLTLRFADGEHSFYRKPDEHQ